MEEYCRILIEGSCRSCCCTFGQLRLTRTYLAVSWTGASTPCMAFDVLVLDTAIVIIFLLLLSRFRNTRSIKRSHAEATIICEGETVAKRRNW